MNGTAEHRLYVTREKPASCYTEASATEKPAGPNSAACSYLYVVAIWSAPARQESAARVGELGASRGSGEAAVSKQTTAGLTRGFFIEL